MEIIKTPMEITIITIEITTIAMEIIMKTMEITKSLKSTVANKHLPVPISGSY